ncbi:MAG TPA: UDP-N-acetylmuramoyl-tripeptide--D-alanyl-D-alanine ligase [Candidatus Acidoferrum sp.]|nr:UDP-N-acetylmuramoyl-tripeptide--D-alanyl-D-alanine ligase [Candidatus Acidoferrum sp.]
MFKSIVVSLLEWQAKRLLRKHKPRVVAITGSIGKTSTKLFTATVLGQHWRVLAHEGNHNTEVTIPLSLFNIELPDSLKSPLAWLAVLRETGRRLKQPFEYDVVVLELGTDKPGDIARFGKYLRADIGVVTAVVPEHMEFFKTIEAVAQEELTVVGFSQFSLLNIDDIDVGFRKNFNPGQIGTYGLGNMAQYHYLVDSFEPVQGFTGKFVAPEFGERPVALKLLGEHNIKSAVAAGAIAVKLGLGADEVALAMQKIQPVPGRMQLLRGLKESTLIDDTYNSSPTAAVAALQTLYSFDTEQRIAILGSMNELGDYSEKAHQEVGLACDPAKLEWVITIGEEAEKYLAPAALSRGNQVKSFTSPLEAGAFAHKVLRPHAVVLAKGSQNRIFAEEALKMLLHTTEDEHKLVRQSPDWLAIKQSQFENLQTSAPPAASQLKL